MILFVELVLLLEGYMTDALIFFHQLLYTLLQTLASFFSSRFQSGYHITLLLQILSLFTMHIATSGIASLEEGIAGGGELFPQLVAQFLRYHTYLAPFLLQVDELVGGRLPVSAVLQLLGLFDEGAFLVGIAAQILLHGAEIFSFTGEEIVAGGTETLKDFNVHLLGSKADGLPFCLQVDNLTGVLVPVAAVLVFLSSNGLYLLAEGCLTLQVFFLFGAQSLKVLLVALVDYGAGCLEALPDFLAQLLAYRTDLTILLMQLLQLMEGTDNIAFFGQLLSSLAELGLQLQILLEVIFTGLAIQFQQVVELLYIQLIVTP